MKKRLFFLLGVLAGLLIGEVLRRKKMERLNTLEQHEVQRQAVYAESNRRWQKELAKMSFEERMEYELFEASLKSYNYQPDWNDEEEEDDEAEA
jgi:hypothetical protein